MAISILKSDLIYPYFVTDAADKKERINNFPGVYRFSIGRLLEDISGSRTVGIKKVLLFGIPGRKDNEGSLASSAGNAVARAVKGIKKEFKDLTVFTDVCLCAYTTHGHCGLLKKNKREIDPRRTLNRLADIALSHADAGADFVAPSAMAKGQVGAIRRALNKNGFEKTGIMGYSAKFASNFYGPFRGAASSAPKFGDRSGYQLDFRDGKKAIREIRQDIAEGADIVMVKPALSYLDLVKEASLMLGGYPVVPGRIGSRVVPLLAAFNVSGEYAAVKYGAKRGLWDEEQAVIEIITAIKRSGADLIISYHAKDVARWLDAGK